MPDMTHHQPAAGISRRGLLTAGVLVLAGAGCASAPSAVRSGIEKPELTVGAVGAVTAAGLYVAQQRGFFAAEGLTVTIVPTTGSGPVMADLLNGRLDVSFGNYVSFIAAQARGAARLRILAEGNNATAHEQEITVLPHSPVTSVAGLRGKTIGVNALANVATLIVSSVLAGNDIPPTAVRFVAIPFPQMGEALAARRIDAALGLGNVTLARADATEPPYADGSADVVTASMMIFLLPDPARALRAWLRLLRPGGTLAFSWNIAEDPRWVPVIAAVDAYMPGGDGFAAVLHHPPFTSARTVQAMLADAGYTGIATAAEAIETRYTGPRQWWAASWSQAPRIAWQHIPPGRRNAARTAAFGLLQALRDQNDRSLTRRPVIGYTTARTPASPPPEGPAQ